jgi:Microcystin-dependent protein
MNRGNFLGQPNRDFPVDCETFDFIQANQVLIAVLGQIAGDKVILSGCTKTGSLVAPGYVYLKTTQYPDGEVLRFDGGTIDAANTTVYIAETAVSVSASGYNYPQAYYTRSLKTGLGTEQFLWSDFSTVETNATLKARCKALEDEVALLAPLPVGIPQIWTGPISKIPSGMVLYDGRAVNIADYPKAYSVWGTMYNNYNGKTTPDGQFRIPDLSHMFMVGYDATDDDYSTIGKQGGEKEHVLTIDEMPSHNHQIYTENGNDGSNGNHELGGDLTGRYTANAGGGKAHENRPPYFTVAYIGRLE